jgi:nicotinate-nucleotide pyrophosphorylase (carboxylating)
MTAGGAGTRWCDVSIEPPGAAVIRRIVHTALLEDRAWDDVTTLATVPASLRGEAVLLVKEPGVVAGLPVVAAVLDAIDPALGLTVTVGDGEKVGAGTTIGRVTGPVHALLRAERVALNFLQRLSGTASLTRRFVEAVQGTRAVILDTRKTTPGLRDLEKYAVRCGGGTNHRRDLAAMAMIKDNHREALARAGMSLADGVSAIRARTPGVEVEVEIDALAQLDEALAAAPEWILLDNMAPPDMRAAVERVKGRARLEASGGITLLTVRAVAETGVDAISAGALTHSAPALDISLDLSF